MLNYSIDSLVAFEATCRLQSFSHAASELGLTQPTISYRVKKLEEVMQTVLFERKGGSCEPSPAGSRLHAKLLPLLQSLNQAIESEANIGRKDRITITTSPAFASIWLLPRLSRFQDEYPNIEVDVLGTDRVLDLSHEADLAIRPNTHTSLQATSNLLVFDLFADQQFAVCSPSLLSDNMDVLDGVDALKAVKRPMLIHDENVAFWENYLKATGCSNDGLRDGPVLSNADLTLRAAISGMGIALMRTSYAANYLSTQVLVKLPLPEMPAEFNNVAVCKRASYQNKSLRRFIDWIQAEAELSAG
ncbi:LysR substrate-binding domain-containing protein [Roseibium sp. SCP14]|uniref:LysR substrate-binding domain-containing protein n=1 Tax=Roseibium sp. SCP14 TaxID=3141375 RepID=UPI0033389759